MSENETLHIGPPFSVFGGMNTTLRRQQMPPPYHRMLKNIDLIGDSLRRRPGMVRIAVGARPAESLSGDGNSGTYIDIPRSDTSDITEYDLGTAWTVFVAYSIQGVGAVGDIFATDTAASPGVLLSHNTNGSITATVIDKATNSSTVTSTTLFPALNTEVVVQLVRDGADVTLFVNGTQEDTDASLSATSDTKVTGTYITLGDLNLSAHMKVTYYEVRLHREAITDHEWQHTQYPWTGRFGDANLVLHLTFEEGTGTAITDHSRVNNASIVTTGGWTWNASTLRQVIVPVTGVHIKQNTLGRKWILFDAGKNHYRIAF